MPEPFQKGNSREYVENYERIFKKKEERDAKLVKQHQQHDDNVGRGAPTPEGVE